MSIAPYDRPARMPSGPASGQQLRSGDPHDPDPFDEIPGIAPNLGQDVLPHVVTFQGILRNVARTYYVSDEAIRHSWDNARFMRNDPGIMECLEQRQRSTALLGWHLEAEDEKDPTQKMLVDELSAIIRQIPNFLKYRECLLHALWYGKYAISHRYRWGMVGGRQRVVMQRWRPLNGDKLVFRYDDGSGEYDDDQVGIRIGPGYTAGSQIAGRWKVERFGKIAATDHGLAYFLEHWERPLLAIHKHMIEDAEYEDPARAGAINGVGIRSRLYWLWYQKQETLAWLMEYLERSAFGIEIWSYPAGNKAAYDQTRKAAEERIGLGRNIVLVPRHPDSDVLSSDVKRIEPGMQGADVLDRIIREYFGWQIKRYILGQILTSETASTGLGSGVATIHLDTYLQIVRYDATNLAETLTSDLVKPLIRYNWPAYVDLPIRFVIETEAPDVDGKLAAWERAYNMGLRIRALDVAELIGASMAQPDEEVLSNPQHRQAAMQERQMQEQGRRQQLGVAAGNGDVGPRAELQKLISTLSGKNGEEQYGRLRPGVERLVYDHQGRLKRIERYRNHWEESEHPRDHEGKFIELERHEVGYTTAKGEHKTRLEWRMPGGGKLPAHAGKLKLPPGWQQANVSIDPSHHVVATGRDSKGREQRVYSPEHVERQAAAKFARVQEGIAKREKMIAQNDANLNAHDAITREAASVWRLIDHTGIRPGSDRDTKAEKQAYGATTLLGRHVTTDENGGVVLRFTGKKGVDLAIAVRDAEIARDLLRRKDAAGDDGRLFQVDADQLLAYCHSLDGGGFKTKDFRTIKGTLTARKLIGQTARPATEKERRKAIREVAKEVSAVLGNTPTVALQSYIDPHEFDVWKLETAP